MSLPTSTILRLRFGPQMCRNLSLEFVTKAKACKGASQERSPRVTFHVLESVGKCEGMNLHIPK